MTAVALLTAVTLHGDAKEVVLAPYDSCDAATKAVVQKVVNAFGGDQRIDAVFNLHLVETAVLREGPQQQSFTMDALVVFPGSVRALIRSDAGTVTLVVQPDSAFMVVPGAISGAALKLTDDQREVLLRNLYAEPLFVLRRRHEHVVAFGLEASSTSNGRTVDVLRVDIEQQQLRWFVDHDSGRLLRTAVGGVDIDLQDWKSVSGLNVPFSGIARSPDEKEVGRSTYDKLEINVPSDTAELFRTPTLWLTQMAIPDSAPAVSGKAGFSIPDSSRNATSRRVFLPDYGSRVYVYKTYVAPVYVAPYR